MITAEQFAEWKSQPVTMEIFTALTDVRQELQERLSSGQTTSSNAEATQGMTNKIVGQIEGLNQLLNISYEDAAVVEDADAISGY